MQRLQYIDLFCGIGGFRLAAQQVCQERDIESVCVFSSDIDPECQITYEANFGQESLAKAKELGSGVVSARLS